MMGSTVTMPEGSVGYDWFKFESVVKAGAYGVEASRVAIPFRSGKSPSRVSSM